MVVVVLALQRTQGEALRPGHPRGVLTFVRHFYLWMSCFATSGSASEGGGERNCSALPELLLVGQATYSGLLEVNRSGGGDKLRQGKVGPDILHRSASGGPPEVVLIKYFFYK
jgi:hypothetical protein